MPKSQKEFLEQHIIKKRNEERDRLEYWSGTSKYYDRMEAQTQRFQELVSQESTQASTNAFIKAKEAEKRREGLLVRRAKLKNLMQREKEEWDRELKTLPRTELDITDLRQVRQQFRLAKEEEQKKEAELKMLQHWKINNPTARQVESAKTDRMVRKCWDQQLREKREEDDRKKRLEEELHMRRIEEERRKQEEQEKEEKERKLRIARLSADLEQQLAELRHREREAEALERAKFEEEEFRRRMEEVEEERKRREKNREQRDLSTYQKRQHQQKLKKVSEEVEKELEEDSRRLQEMVSLVEAQDRIESEQKNKCLQEVLWMQGVLRDQEAEEQRRKAEMELMYSEEAEKMWNKQQEIWDREEKARQRLMEEVTDSWRQQNLDRLNQERLKREEAAKQRMQISQHIQELKSSLQEEETARKVQQEELVTGLDDGLRRAEQKKRQIRFRDEEESIQRRLQEIREENKLARHLAQVELDTDAPPSAATDFRRRKVKWYY